MIQMTHIFVLSQAEFVGRQVRTAIAEQRPARGMRSLLAGWLRH